MPRAEEHQENGQAQYDFDPIERFDATEFAPDAPVGGWDFIVVSNETKRKATRPKQEGDKRYPMLILSLSLQRAHDEENQKHEGTKLDFLITAWGPDKPKAGNASKRDLQEFCKAVGVDMSLFPHGEALSAGSFAVFDEFVEAVEGREGKLWTSHQPMLDEGGQETGEMRTRIAFKAPKANGKASAREAAPPGKASRNGSASGKKPAARAASGRR